ncbi:MAG: hypothetical protein QOJ21_2429, partial [Solirubrobacteraceae bacterium]|nr:hypothetical protein [Solirubrobacteraceae bacterium]
MSALGVVAAASSIGTGLFALTSDILPYRGWPGDAHRATGSQVLPAAERDALA